MKKNISTKRILLLLVVLTPVFVIVGAARAQSAGWSVGDSTTKVYTDPGSPDLNAYATSDFNVTANHIRLVGNDGNIEFENGNGVTHINSYKRGTATRNPITIGGGDEQNVTGLILDSGSTQTADIQQFRKNGTTLTAIDSQGRLRISGIPVELKVINGNLEWVATMPDGSLRYNKFSTRP